MQIKRLRIAGFKSFVDPLDLPILAGLTGVVGPNGCGKSNLLEAMRWTMGEASARSLRGAEMDDVIFAGTATRPARNFAEVSLLVEVPAADGPVEREVVRRIERGAGSAYRLDGRDVRARDVQLLFADAASGAHSPALVSQGRIGAVIAAKPGDRRAMLEEAAGIAGLHVRRREAETRLRAAEANLARLDLLIADQTARAGQLRRQARAAERYRALSDQVRVAEARLIFARWRDAATAADAARADVAAIEGRVAQAQAAETAAAHAQAIAAGRQVDARDAALTACDAANASALALADHRRGLADVERQVRDLTESRRRLVDERGREGELARAAATALEQLRATRAQLDAELTAAAHASPVLDAALTAAERRARDAEVELARIQAQRASETADARIAAAARQAAQARAARIARDATQLAAQRDATGDATLLADRDAAAARRLAAAVASERARHELAAADGAERAALDARATAERARAAAAAAFAALEAEITALIASTAPVGGDRLLDHLHAAPGWERALAAALDDAADTPLAAWTGATPAAGDPPPPPGASALADHVEAPAALARRLGQLFVADADEGQPLAAGQRLVTRAGALRRWDGYRRDSAGAAAATRLAQANRLATLRADQPNVAAAYDAAAAGYARCDAALRAERQRAEAARAALTEAEAAMREAARAEDRAASALERRQAQRVDLDARAQRVAAEGEDAAVETARAVAVIAALPDGRATAQAAAALARAADLARVSVAQARGALAAADAVAGRLREQLAAAAADARNWRARAGEAAHRVADADRRETELAAAEAALAGQPAALAAVIATDERAHAALVAAAATAQVAERAAEAVRAAADAAQRDAAQALAQLRESRAGALARLEAQELRRVELGRVSGERFSCPAPILPERLGFDPAAVDSPAAESATHGRLTAARESLGPVNLVAANQLAELETGAAGNAAERGDLGEAIHRLRGAIGALNREGRQRLLATFAAVDGHFRHLYGALFHGGRAHLELVDADDPLDAGLEIMAQPPGKRLQSLTLLSGGEQALTAVALIFALFLTNPAPICVLDEVDAPLDDANIERFCDLLDRMARDTDTRYLIVTHNAVTMSRMHRLFGVTMVEPGVSRLVAVDLRSATTMVAA